MSDDNDPFPEAPSYEELEELKHPMDEFDDIVEFSNANEQWYNKAVPVAARLMIEVAREHEGFRQDMVESDEFGAAHSMLEYDEEKYHKLNQMGLSANQGGHAENAARKVLREEYDD